MHPPEALPLNKFKFPVSFRSNSALPVKIQTATGTLRGGVRVPLLTAITSELKLSQTSSHVVGRTIR